MNDLIVARWLENVEWARALVGQWHVDIWEKGTERTGFRNVGRECGTYLRYLCQAYDEIPDEVVFCQGDPFDHDPNFLVHLDDPLIRWYGQHHECDLNGRPAMDDAHLQEHRQVFGLPSKATTITFPAGAQYRVTREQIQRHPRDFYVMLLGWCEHQPRAPFVLERLWPEIFGFA